MTLKEFLDHTQISIADFARAMEIPKVTLYTMLHKGTTPKLELAYRIIIQSGYNVSLEDLIPPSDWKPKKIKTKIKFTIDGKKLKKHERRQYFKDIDIL
jgi:hypothetical protein